MQYELNLFQFFPQQRGDFNDCVTSVSRVYSTLATQQGNYSNQIQKSYTSHLFARF